MNRRHANHTLNKLLENIYEITKMFQIYGYNSIKHTIMFIMCKYLSKNICCFYERGKLINDNNLFMDKFYKDHENSFMNKLKQINFDIDIKIDSAFIIKYILEEVKLLEFNRNLSIDMSKNIIDTIFNFYDKKNTDMRSEHVCYTNVDIINYMIGLVQPKMKNNTTIESILDPCCGLGNFLTKSIQYLNSRYYVDWTTNMDNINGYDIDNNMVGLTKANILLDNQVICNSIYKRCAISQDNINNSDIILADIPSDIGSTTINYNNYCDKIKQLNILNPIKKINLESLFILLIISSLNINGRSAIIVPYGFLLDNLYNVAKIRSHLITNYNIKKIVYIGEGVKNNHIKQVILYFSNEIEKTTKIEYCEIKYENGTIQENKLLTVSINDIISNEYKLHVDDYKKLNIKRIENIEYVKLKDICTFEPKPKRHINYGTIMGKYPFYTSSLIVNYCNKPDYNCECLIISMLNKLNVRLDSKFSCSTDNYVIKSQYNKYLLYWFQSNAQMLDNLYSGNGIKYLSKYKLENIVIPLPSINAQKKIIIHIDSIHQQIKLYKSLINIQRNNITSTEYYNNLMLNYNDNYNDNQNTDNLIITLDNKQNNNQQNNSNNDYHYNIITINDINK